ncbi:MAG: hypothetical protein EAZ85_15105, partial [Bacteroidetes bacterium]
LASLSTEQRAIYEENLIQYWGMKSAIETAVETAVETALEGKKIEIAKNFIILSLDNVTIAKGIGLTIEQIEQLRKEINKK